MEEDQAAHARGTRGLVALACAVALLARPLAAHADAPADGQPSLIDRLLAPIDRLVVPKCLTPAVDGVFADLARTGSLQRALGDGFAIERADAGGNHIDLVIQDAAHRPYGITLALAGSRGGRPDGQGHHFLFFLSDGAGPADPAATTALLAAAALLDQAMPDTAIVDCSAEGNAGAQVTGGATDERDGGEKRYPLALALTSAVLELAVLLAAILFGLRAIRSRDSDR